MQHYINNIDFYELEAMKYYSYPSTWSAEKQKADTHNLIFSGNWYGSQKRDGFFMKFLKDEDGNITFTGRSKATSGDYLNKWDWVPQLHEWAAAVPNGTCFIGEIYWPNNEGSKNTTSIMNCLKDKAIARQKEEQNKLHYYIFDVLAYDGAPLYQIKAIQRFHKVMELGLDNDNHYVEFAQYVSGQELWATLQELLANGYEGMVITHKDAPYEPGKRPSKTTRKLKKTLSETIDCVIMGAVAPTKPYKGDNPQEWQYWWNEHDNVPMELGNYYKGYMRGDALIPVTKAFYYHWAGSFKLGLYKDGELVHYGDLSGLTDEMKENWQSYVGRVAEVGGMSLFTDTGAIRHPKLIGIRPVGDKSPQDCTWSQIN